MDNNNLSYVCTSFAQTIFGALFVYLKLTEQIDWTWLWVLSPFWLPVAVVLGLLVIVFAISMIVIVLGDMRYKF